jgi:hypothetical protein
MPSHLHEVLVEMFRERPFRSWLVYLATLHARLDCPVILLVVCPDRTVATWCAAPIVFGHPGLVLTPLVLGPDRVPEVSDSEVARLNPELAVLSAIAHGTNHDPGKVFEAMLAGLSVIHPDRADLYYDVVSTVLPKAARDLMESLMSITTRRPQSDNFRRLFDRGAAQGEARGEARAERRAVLAVLEARGLAVTDDVRERITTCTDIEQLDAWVRRAATATTVDDLFN